MKALKFRDLAPSAPSPGDSSRSLRPLSIPSLRTPWRFSLRDLAAAVLITFTWLLIVGLGVAFWTAIIWWAAR
jgi:hypothetical protein